MCFLTMYPGSKRRLSEICTFAESRVVEAVSAELRVKILDRIAHRAPASARV